MKKDIKTFLLDYPKLLGGLLHSIKKALWFLARDAFLFTLVLVLLSVVFGEFLFYHYILLPEIKNTRVESDVVTFQQELYMGLLQKLQTRQKMFGDGDGGNYENPF